MQILPSNFTSNRHQNLQNVFLVVENVWGLEETFESALLILQYTIEDDSECGVESAIGREEESVQWVGLADNG